MLLELLALLLLLPLVVVEGVGAVVMTALRRAATRASWSLSASWALPEGGPGVVMA